MRYGIYICVIRRLKVKTLHTKSRASLLLVIQNLRTLSTVHYFIAYMFTIIKLPSTGPIENFYLNYQTESFNRFRCLPRLNFLFLLIKSGILCESF